MPPSLTRLQRAYQLARTGSYPTIVEICDQLHREGYGQVHGPALNQELLPLLKKVNHSTPRSLSGQDEPV